MNTDTEQVITSDMEKGEEEFEEECAREQERIRKTLEEEENAELKEHQYKRLMHLLTRSKFYTQFMMDKLERRQKQLKESCLASNSEEDKSSNESTKVIGDKLKDTTNMLQSNTSQSAKEESDTKEPVNTKKRKRKANQKYDIADIIDAETIKKVNAQEWPKEKSQEVNTPNEHNTEQMRKTAYGITVSIRQPQMLEGGALRPYQLDSLDWLRVLYENGINGILADEMGLGKTIQAIALFCHLVDKGAAGPFLVVAPLSTLPNWLFECEKFAPRLPVVLFHGDKDKRIELYPYLTRRHMIDGKRLGPVVLTSYQIAAKERILGAMRWSYLVVDEGHRLKNFNCVLGGILRGFKAENRLLLTGTPIQNDLSELWSMLNFLMPDVFDDLAVFESWFNVSDLTQSGGNEKILKQEEKTNVLTMMHQILTPFLLRRVKADVQLDIPPKKEILVYAPMSPIQLELYRATVERNYAKLLKNDDEGCLIIPDEPDGSRAKRKCSRMPKRYDLNSLFRLDGDAYESSSEKSFDADSEDNIVVVDKNDKDYKIVLKMQNPMMQLRKIVNHPYLVHFPLERGKKKLRVDEELINKSGKLLVLDAMLAKLKERGHKVLLFSTFTMLLDIIEEYLLMRQYKYVRLDGSVSLEDRQESIRAFNTNPDLFIYIISTRAGGLGINLTAADTVIIYDSDWNPQVDLQAQDRCHRIGQTKPVVVYRFVTAGTIDEQIVERAAAKRKLEKMVIHKGRFKLNRREQQELVTLRELMALLDSRDHQQVIHSNGYVFTNEELDALLDRSDLMSSSKETVPKGKEMDNVYKVIETKADQYCSSDKNI